MPLAIDGSTTHFITLDEVKRAANLPVSSTVNDAELTIIQGAAEDAVEGIVGPVRWRTVVETGAASSSVVLNTLPVVSVTSFTGAGSDVAYTLDARSGMLTGVTYSGTATVTYVAGRTSCPDAIRQAALIIAAHLWETQRGNAPSAMPEDDFAPPGEGAIGYAIPRRAEDLLAPYTSLPGIA